ncbi:TlpA disulfide reductase family protein [Neolewinella aurantiaca]|nr:TlpA disulfide reductase family protein [Neolewinella aurantiaca]
MHKLLSVAAILVSFLYLACGQSISQASAPTLPEPVRDTVTEVSVYDFAELEKRLYTSSDSTYIVNFWAMWCAPCVKELPYFERFLAKHAGEKTAALLVSMDFPKDIDSKLLPFLNTRKIFRSDVVLLDAPDANSWIPRVDPAWSGAIPATLIFNRDTSVFFARPFADLEDLEAAVASINQ